MVRPGERTRTNRLYLIYYLPALWPIITTMVRRLAVLGVVHFCIRVSQFFQGKEFPDPTHPQILSLLQGKTRPPINTKNWFFSGRVFSIFIILSGTLCQPTHPLECFPWKKWETCTEKWTTPYTESVIKIMITYKHETKCLGLLSPIMYSMLQYWLNFADMIFEFTWRVLGLLFTGVWESQISIDIKYSGCVSLSVIVSLRFCEPGQTNNCILFVLLSICVLSATSCLQEYTVLFNP